MRAEKLRAQPYRLFFPLGLAISWLGVGQWLLFGRGVIQAYLSIFHAMAQVQGFLVCFAMGFLFTMLPRRTESPPPGIATLAVCALCPIATTFAALYEQWALAQLFWLVLLGTLVTFVVSRMRGGERRAPVAFLWIPGAVACGVVGSLMTGIGAIRASTWVLHEAGRALVLQGFFLCLVIGVGSFVVPLFTRGRGLADAGSTTRREELVHLFAALALTASFWVEAVHSTRWAYALRSVAVLAVLLFVGEIYRRPTKPGSIRRLVWIGAWCVPLGYLLAASFPLLGKGALHVTFIGGFGLLALAVSAQVILGHGGYERLRDGRSFPLLAVGLVLATALAARLVMELREPQLLFWMSWSAALFLVATAIWAALLVPRLLREPGPEE